MAAHPEPAGAAWAGAGAGGRAGTPPAEATMPIYSSGEVSVFVVLVWRLSLDL